ncbi:cytochrome P450 [Streptomyces albus]|uniref:cytochrome P450 n=1 Tax=Streptomyces albus TaxID=1888 RepID=UPI0036F982A9
MSGQPPTYPPAIDPIGPDGLHRLYGPEWEADPMAVFEKLRAEYGALAPVLLPGDVHAWLVLGHRENGLVAGNASVFSRDPRNWKAMRDGLITHDHPLAPVTRWQRLLVFVDGLEHRWMRDAVIESLKKFEQRGVRRLVVQHTDEAIDELVAGVGHGEPRADLVGLANRVSLKVVLSLFGMDDYFDALSADMHEMISGGTGAAAAGARVTATFQDVVEQRKQSPGHDLPSILLAHGMDDEVVRETLRVITAAANEPTAQLMLETFAYYLGDPKSLRELRGASTTVAAAVARVLWDRPPMITNIGRWATGTTKLAGRRIEEGDMLLLGIGAANHDPAARATGDDLQNNRASLAFSHGPHACPGETMGRGIVETFLDRLMYRLPSVRLAAKPEELPRKATLMIWQFLEMPFTWDRDGALVVLRKREADGLVAGERIRVPSPTTAKSAIPEVRIS